MEKALPPTKVKEPANVMIQQCTIPEIGIPIPVMLLELAVKLCLTVLRILDS